MTFEGQNYSPDKISGCKSASFIKPVAKSGEEGGHVPPSREKPVCLDYFSVHLGA